MTCLLIVQSPGPQRRRHNPALVTQRPSKVQDLILPLLSLSKHLRQAAQGEEHSRQFKPLALEKSLSALPRPLFDLQPNKKSDFNRADFPQNRGDFPLESRGVFPGIAGIIPRNRGGKPPVIAGIFPSDCAEFPPGFSPGNSEKCKNVLTGYWLWSLEQVPMVCTATLVHHKAWTRCLTSFDCRHPVELRDHFWTHNSAGECV
jgi:hypothetical protein